MTLSPPNWRQTQYIHRIGLRADQPNADTVTIGTLYCVTDEGKIERSNGVTWDNFSWIDPLTISKLIGGTGVTDGLSLQSTSGNGTSRADFVKFLLGNNGSINVARFINNAGAGFLLINETALKFTGLASAKGGMEVHVETDVNFAITPSIDVPSGLAFQGYNDAVLANIGFEFRGQPIGFTIGLSIFTQHFARSGTVTPSALAAGNNNDYNPSGLGGETSSGAYCLRLTGDAGGTSAITGIDGGLNYTLGGRELLCINVGSFAIAVKHDDAASAADNRILTPTGAAITFNTNDSFSLWYDSSSGRWRMVNVCQ